MNILAHSRTAIIFVILISIGVHLPGGLVNAADQYNSNGSNVSIPDAGSWVYSPIVISGAPTGAVVTSIDVHFSAVHAYSGDLDVDLNDEGITRNYDIWANEDGSADNPSRTVNGITTFNGLPVNGTWKLFAQDITSLDAGYIDEWWIRIYYTADPDLSVQSVDATSGTYNPGDSVVVGNVIQNIGGDSSPSYRVDFYASTNTTITSGDYSLGYVNRSSLGAGGTHNYNTTTSLPSNIPAGNYYIGIIVTSSNDSDSSNDKGYDSTPITVAVTSPSEPDLVASNLSISESDGTVFAGDSITVYFNIKNQGAASAGSSYQGIMLSNNTTITSSDAELASEYTGFLLSGADTNETNYNVSIPTGISGRWYIGILVDKDNDVVESNETNNNTAYIPIDIPNWEKSKWVNNQGCYVGGPLNPIPVVVKGNGSAAEKQAVADQLSYWNEYASLFSAITQDTGNGSLGNGINEINSLISTQDALSNYGYTMQPNLLGRAMISQGSSFGTFNECKDFISDQGDTFEEVDILINDDFQGTWVTDPEDSYYDSLIQATALHEIGHTLGLHHVWTLPSFGDSFSVMNYGTHAARYFVTRMDANTLRVHNPDHVQSVLDVGIFPFIFGNSQDAATYTSVSPSTVSSGDYLDISNMLVQNIGNQAASNVVVSFYLSTNTNITSSDYLISTFTDTSLPLDTEYDLNASLIVPNNIPAGDYYIGAIVTVNGSEDSIGINNKFIIGRPSRTIITVTASPPTVTTNSASSIGQTGATL
ncbi:CARDB domain-containing protein, partial [Pseudomonadota bacterium]